MSFPNQASLTSIRQTVHLSSLIHVYVSYCSHLHPPSLIVVHNYSIIAEHQVMLSLSISPCHDHQLTPSTEYTKDSIHQVWHTYSMTDTKYNIHQVRHTPSTTYTQYDIHPVRHTLTPTYPMFNIHWVQHRLITNSHPPSSRCWLDCYMQVQFPMCLATDWPWPASSVRVLKSKPTHHIPTVATKQTDEYSLSTHYVSQWTTCWLTTTKNCSNVTGSWPPIASLHSVDHNLQLHVLTHLVTSSDSIA